MKKIYKISDTKILISFLLICFISGVALLLVNGTTANDTNRINFDFNNLEIKLNDLVKYTGKSLVFLQGINSSNYVEVFNLNFNSDVENEIIFDELDRYKVKLVVDFKKAKMSLGSGESHFYMGFTDYSQVAYEQNYFEISSNKTNLHVSNKGSEIFLLHNENLSKNNNNNNKNNKNKNEIILEYFIDNINNTVKCTIQIDGYKHEKSANLGLEYPKGFTPQDFWFTVTQTNAGEFAIKELSLEY